ncbi:hypothetical protein CRUP_012937 [Coryphaenoides rupestris]|nr:hypothetical protein CRUP_012937 [Coryphaenoides rupestris]
MDYDEEWWPWLNGSYPPDTGAASNSNSSGFAFESPLTPLLDKILNVCVSITIFITMMSLGCTMDWSKIKAFHLEALQAVAVLVCGCCPGGTLIVMTSCSTVLALGMMPLLLYIYCQGFLGLVNVVPYSRIIVALVILAVMTITILAIIALASITVGKYILLVMSPSLLAIGCLMPLIGFILGYCLAAIFKLNGSSRRTISIETGCQNIQLASTILKMGFPPEVIGPLFMFPIVYILFQLTEAGLFILLSRTYQKYRTKQKATTPTVKEVFPPTDAYVEVKVLELDTWRDAAD